MSYSELSDKLNLTNLVDELIKFGKINNNLNLLNSNYNIPYNTYSHSFTGLNKAKLNKYISNLKSFNLSYSSMDNYNRCSFRFYIDKILCLKDTIDKFSVTLGNIYHNVLEKAVKKDIDVRIFGFDIDENQIRLARKHAILAGVDKYLHLQRGDMREFSSKNKYGVIISNPPYGERLSDRNGIKVLYKDFGKLLANFPDWSCYVLTSVLDFERLYGRVSSKKRKIYNGKLECCFYSFLGEKTVIIK